jgi:hypothetical protein
MKLKIKPESIGKILLLIGILASLSYVSKHIKSKEDDLNKEFNTNSINKYLLEQDEILKSSKPILWIHIPRETNARQINNLGSPNSNDLNMPYVYLTVRSIIEKCGKSFTICLIDDDSFKKLLPGWEIDLDKLKNPILDNVRTMGFLKLLYLYGGVLCPHSFLCQRDMIDLYNLSYTNSIAISFEKRNNGTSNIVSDYVPNVRFMASYPLNDTIKQLCSFMEELISKDNTHESQFLERIGMQCEKYVKTNKISKHCGSLIGIKMANNKDVQLEDLMTSDYVEFSENRYGIFIPQINRPKFEWFNYLNAREIMSSDTTIGKQILLTLGDEIVAEDGIQETPNFDIDKNILPQNMKPQEMKQINNSHVGYWETPLGVSVWGLKPNNLGDYLLKK